MKIYFIRHAEEGKKEHLSDRGRHQAKELGQWLRKKNIASIFSSDRLRAEETAEIAASVLGLRNQVLPKLEEVRELNLDETDEQVSRRVWQGLQLALEKSSGRDIAVVAHSKLIRVLLNALHLRHYHEDDPDLPNTGVAALYYQNGQYRLADYAVLPHDN